MSACVCRPKVWFCPKFGQTQPVISIIVDKHISEEINEGVSLVERCSAKKPLKD